MPVTTTSSVMARSIDRSPTSADFNFLPRLVAARLPRGAVVPALTCTSLPARTGALGREGHLKVYYDNGDGKGPAVA